MKPIKAFSPYTLSSPALFNWCKRAAKSTKTAEVLAHYLAKDPASHAYESLGLLAPFESDKPVHDLDGSAYLLLYQYNQRILPGAVRDEKMRDRIAALREKEDRDLTKTEYAQVRSEVEKELLPKAFIRRTHVPVFVYKDKLVICVASAKRQEDIIIHLSSIMTVRSIEGTVENIFTNLDLLPWLKETALDGESISSTDRFFQATDAAVFKGSDKRKVSVKDRDISHAEVQNLLVNGAYAVIELRMDYRTEDSELLLTFSLTDKLVFKGIKLAITEEVSTAEDAHATYFIYAKQFAALVADVIDVLGGEAAATDEDEEL